MKGQRTTEGRGTTQGARPLRARLSERLGACFGALGVHGLGAVALPLVACLVLSEALLLLGRHGGAKSTLARRLAWALGLEPFRTYDVSKVMWEDVLGWPLVRDGRAEYVETPLSMRPARCVFLDELNRSSALAANKLLEVVREHTLMGQPLPELRQVIAAMNPLGYEGTQRLDEALASRFTAVVVLPEARDLQEPDRRAVIRHLAERDALGVAFGAAPRPDAAPLRDLIETARARYRELAEPEVEALITWTDQVGRTFDRHEHPLDGRRLGQLSRLARAALAVGRAALGEPLPLAEASPLLLATLEGGLPFAALGVEAGPPLLRAAHELAFAAATGRQLVTGHWTLPLDPLRTAAALASAGPGLPPSEQAAAVTRLIEGGRRSDLDPDARGASLLGLGLLVQAVTQGRLSLPADDAQRALEAWSVAMQLPEDSVWAQLETLDSEAAAGLESLQEPRRALCLRVAARALCDHMPHHRGRMYASPQQSQEGALGRLASELERRLSAVQEAA